MTSIIVTIFLNQSNAKYGVPIMLVLLEKWSHMEKMHQAWYSRA